MRDVGVIQPALAAKAVDASQQCLFGHRQFPLKMQDIEYSMYKRPKT